MRYKLPAAGIIGLAVYTTLQTASTLEDYIAVGVMLVLMAMVGWPRR